MSFMKLLSALCTGIAIVILMVAAVSLATKGVDLLKVLQPVSDKIQFLNPVIIIIQAVSFLLILLEIINRLKNRDRSMNYTLIVGVLFGICILQMVKAIIFA